MSARYPTMVAPPPQFPPHREKLMAITRQRALPEPGPIELRVEALIKATGIDFRIGGNRAPAMCWCPPGVLRVDQLALHGPA
jgi:hypothetical protein